MRLIAFVDTHGSAAALRHIKKVILQQAAKKKPVDLAVCCGDFTIFGQKIGAPLKAMNALGVPVLLIHGNHEMARAVRHACKKYRNLIFIDRSSHRVGDIVFLGYGGGGFALEERGVHAWAKTQFGKFRKNERAVLLFHGPPYGTALDVVGGGHCGNKDYTALIRRHHKQICLVLAGHIHECSGETDKIKDVVVANPGPWGMVFEIE